MLVARIKQDLHPAIGHQLYDGALATRLVEQCNTTVLTPRLLEAIENDSGPYEPHKRYGFIKVVLEPAWASIVGAIAERFKQPVFDVKDQDGRKA